MPETYETTLGAVLTHTTGILLADLDEAWPLQDFVVGRPLLTHERTTTFGGPDVDIAEVLLRQFPALAEASPPQITGDTYDEKLAACNAWIHEVSQHTGLPTTGLVVTR